MRNQTFAHVLIVGEDAAQPRVVLTSRSEGDELVALSRAGPPFFVLGWGRNALGVELDDPTHWDEIRELVIECCCVMAPEKLAARAPAHPGGAASCRAAVECR